jgi:hypothetical integral membrane protein (TIGR02206 family)
MRFFSYAPVDPSSPIYLEPFGVYHAAAVAFLAALATLIVLFRKRLRESPLERRILVIATIIAVGTEITLHICEFFSIPFYEAVRSAIPLELCAITLWMAVALSLTKREGIFEILYLWGVGAVASLVFANDGGAGPDRFRYYQYFGTHGYTILVIVYFAVVRGYRITFRSLAKAVVGLIVLSLAVHTLDLAFSGPPWSFNYMYLLRPPDVSTPLDSFGQGWGYYGAFAALSAVLLILVWLPWGVAGLIRGRRKPEVAAAR